MRRRFALAGALAVGTLALAPSALAAGTPAPIYQQAATGVLQNPVYVAQGSGADITPKEVGKLNAQIRKDSVPVYIAILPLQPALDGAGGSIDKTPVALGTAVGRTGVYAVIAGHNFRANSNGALPSGETAQVADNAFQNNSPRDNGGRIYPMLADFVKHVDYGIHPEDKPKSHVGEILGIVFGSLAGLVALVVGLVAFIRRRHRLFEERVAREREQQAFEQRKRDAEADYARVQDQVLAIKLTTSDKSKRCHSTALDAVARARNLIDQAVTVDDFKAARAELRTAESAADDCTAYEDGRDPVKERADEAARLAKLRAESEERERKARLAEAAKRQKEEKERAKRVASVKPSNFAPVEVQSTTHNHYYGGGYYNGSYYGPGYYSDPFWTWVVMDEIMDDRRDDAYDRGYDDARHDDYSSSYGGSSSNDNDWSSSSSSDSGSSGFDFGGGGGSDFGGSFDSGGGSFDSGSGGGSW